MSTIWLTSHWFNSEGSYVPMRERDNSKTVFEELLPQKSYVMDFVNIASNYLHVYTTENKAEELAEHLTENTGFNAKVLDVSNHHYNHFAGNTAIRLKLTLKR